MKPVILVLVGISGDLSKRKILPAIERIAAAGLLPDKFRVIGVSRRKLRAVDVLEDLPASLLDSFLSSKLQLLQMDLESSGAYEDLAKELNQIEQAFGEPAQRLFYLSVPPQITKSIIGLLGDSGLARAPHTQLLLEKPFGRDLESAEELIANTSRNFKEGQVYRIDHYLAKEMAQNILIFRAANPIFKQTWNKDFIDKIEIVSLNNETTIEGRATFYEQTGALRDMIQSHLLQLAALTLMDLPDRNAWNEMPPMRLKALRELIPPAKSAIHKYTYRGQYIGYKEEVGNPRSCVETFAALTLFSSNPRWKDVPISLQTGRALDRNAAEIRLHYKTVGDSERNQLIMRLNPPEGIELHLWSKQPGRERSLREVSLHLDFAERYGSLPEAYEYVLLDAIKGDHSLFTSSDEVLAAWEIVAPLQRAWEISGKDLVSYKPGSTPAAVLALAAKNY